MDKLKNVSVFSYKQLVKIQRFGDKLPLNNNIFV